MTEIINSISDFEKYLKNTKKIVEEALDFSLGPENPKILRESMRSVSYTHLTLPTTIAV